MADVNIDDIQFVATPTTPRALVVDDPAGTPEAALVDLEDYVNDVVVMPVTVIDDGDPLPTGLPLNHILIIREP